MNNRPLSEDEITEIIESETSTIEQRVEAMKTMGVSYIIIMEVLGIDENMKPLQPFDSYDHMLQSIYTEFNGDYVRKLKMKD